MKKTKTPQLSKAEKSFIAKLTKRVEAEREQLENEINLLFAPMKLKRTFYSDPIRAPSINYDDGEDWHLAVEPTEAGGMHLFVYNEWGKLDDIGEAPIEFLDRIGEAFETLIENIIYGAEYECYAVQSIRQKINTKMRNCVMYVYDLYKPKRKTKNYERLMKEYTDK